MSGHLYVEGTISIGIGLPSATGTASGRRLAKDDSEGTKLEIEGTGAMLMRFGGNPRTDPDFGFLLNVNAAPSLTLEGFAIDLSCLQSSATLYVDVPARNKFTFASSLQTTTDVVQLATVVIPGIPPPIASALKKLIGSVQFTAQLDAWISSTTNSWGVHVGVTVQMDQLLGERPGEGDLVGRRWHLDVTTDPALPSSTESKRLCLCRTECNLVFFFPLALQGRSPSSRASCRPQLKREC